MRAKRFFFLAAALFLVAAAYSVASHQAQAQGPELLFVERVGVSGGNDCDLAIDSMGRIYRGDGSAWRYVGQLPPGTPRGLAGIPQDWGTAGHVMFLVGMSNGDVLAIWDQRDGNPYPLDCDREWNLIFVPRGNIFDGTVNVEGKTWSGVKDGYRK